MTAGKPLEGRVALLTGVSRKKGIGYAVLRRLLAEGASVYATGWPAHDAEMPWGEDRFDAGSLPRDRCVWIEADLMDPQMPGRLVSQTVERFGRIDIIVANHARSSEGRLDRVTADELDRCWAVNARASVLLAQALAARRAPGQGGRLILFTSGQHLGPMAEIAYAVSKGAIHQMTLSLADQLAGAGITVNCINPGPVDTGYATGKAHEEVRAGFPSGRWGDPEDVAKLVGWLSSDEAAWITGQVINSTGGWRGTSRSRRGAES
jgi:3-oxoacyl-[acyl-carrier protein] reductase